MGSDKGGVRRGDLFNGVYAMGKMTEDRMNYTGDRVVEIMPAGVKKMALAWTPVIGSVQVTDMDGNPIDFDITDAANLMFDKRLNPNHYANGVYQGAIATPDEAIEAYETVLAEQSAIIANPDATAEEKKAAREAIAEAEKTLKAAELEARSIQLGEYETAENLSKDGYGFRGGYGTRAVSDKSDKKAIILNQITKGPVKVSYIYDNVVIPQDDLPILSAHLESIHLQARARRIAIKNS